MFVRSFLLAGFLAAVCLVGERAHAQGKPQSKRFIELSETNSAEILTNLNQLSSKKDEIRQLEEQLRTLKSISPEDTFEERFSSPYIAPPSSTLPKKTIKELLQKRKNWNLTPEEMGLTTGPSDSELFSTFNGNKSDKDSKRSSLQQFYERLNSKNPAWSKTDQLTDDGKHNAPRRFDSKDQMDADAEEDSKLPDGIRDKATVLREQLSHDSGSIFSANFDHGTTTTKTHSTFDNFFGMEDKNGASDQLRGPKSSMESFVDQFKKVMDGQSSFASQMNPNLKALLPTDAAKSSSVMTVPDKLTISSRHELTESTPGNLEAVLNPTRLLDYNSTILNQWNPLYAAPKLELPKTTTPAPITPNVEFPRRRF